MQQLGSKTFTVDGVTVFSDHADPDQFWYLPAPVQLARRDPGNQAQFTLIKFKPATANAGVKGGGFLMIETELTLTKETENKILAQCAPLSNGAPRLSVVPFDDGTVQCIALNLQGSGGTSAVPSGGNRLTFVEQILGATKPSLQGNNTAAFSLTLGQEGATIMEQVFREGGGPVGVIYQLKFTALRPSLEVEITANFKRIFDSLKMGLDFSAGFVAGGVPIYLKAGIDAAFEKLKEDGIIKIKVINFSSAADAADKEKWALDFFKDKLLAEWFTPTLPPVQFPSQSGGSGINIPGVGNLPVNIPGLGGGNAGGGAHGGGGAAGGGAAGGGAAGGGAAGGGAAAGSGGTAGGGAVTGSGGSVGGGAAGRSHPETAGIPQATLTENTRVPADISSDEYRIEFIPSTSDTGETLSFHGGEQPPVVSVNGTSRTLNGRQLTLDVAPGATLSIRAEYPPAAASLNNFFMFFEFDKPTAAGFSAMPPSAVYRSYLSSHPNPPDQRFQISDGTIEPLGDSTVGGADALRSWIQTELADPKNVTVDAHASYESHDDTAALNLQLTQRRRQVAIGIIGNLAQVTGGTAHGFTEARNANPQRISDSGDRYVQVAGMGRAGNPVTLTATLSRMASGGTPPSGGGGRPGGGTPPSGGGGGVPGGGTPPSGGGGRPGGGTPPAGGGGNQTGMGVSLAFKMQIIRQEEDKNVTLRYNRTEAVQQSYNPQGFIGLLTQDIGPGHFFEVDLDDPFFRTIDIVADSPIDFNRIGLISVQLSLDYGDPADVLVGVKHKDITFDRTNLKEQTVSFSMNRRKDIVYTLGVQYHFDPLSGWDGEKLSYSLPAKITEDRTLLVNPFEDFGFVELKVIPGDIDWSAVKNTDVHLHYEDPGVFSKDTIIALKSGTPEQVWKLRLTHPNQRAITYFFEHHLVDGSVRTSPARTTMASTITVDDSFDAALDIEFIPIFDRNAIRTVFVDILFEDPAHHYKREAHLEFAGASVSGGAAGSGATGGAINVPAGDLRQRLHIALFDPNRTTYQLTYTIVGKDSSIRRLNPINSDSRLVFVGETF